MSSPEVGEPLQTKIEDTKKYVARLVLKITGCVCLDISLITMTEVDEVRVQDGSSSRYLRLDELRLIHEQLTADPDIADREIMRLMVQLSAMEASDELRAVRDYDTTVDAPLTTQGAA